MSELVGRRLRIVREVDRDDRVGVEGVVKVACVEADGRGYITMIDDAGLPRVVSPTACADVTDEAAAQAGHDRSCPHGARCFAASATPYGCLATLRPVTMRAVVAHLTAHPRDARGARRIAHDAVCRSGCGPESDHPDRTQADAIAGIRKYLAAAARRAPGADQTGGQS